MLIDNWSWPGLVLCAGCTDESPSLTFSGLTVKWGNRDANA